MIAGFERTDDANVFMIHADNKQYWLNVFPEHEIARITRERRMTKEVMAGAALGTAIGGAVDAAAGSSRPQEQELTALAGMILGLLVGAAVGATVATSNAPRRVFALRFDPDEKG